MMPAGSTIDELPVPESLDGPEGIEFAGMVELRNTVEADTLGEHALTFTPPEMLAFHRLQEYESTSIHVARLEGRLAGYLVRSWATTDRATVSWVEVGVHPDLRRQGIGGLLVEAGERAAVAAGHRTVQNEAIHTSRPGGPRVTPASGFGDVPATDPGVRFLTRRGYRLEQVGRISLLELPAAPGVLRSALHEASTAAGPDYRVVAWEGPTPDRWQAGMANLRSRMTVEEPSAGLDVDEAPWDESRVAARDREEAGSGRVSMIVAAEHVPTGRLAGYSELSAPPDARPVIQEDTLVLAEHRGHRLGMLLKVANLERLSRAGLRSAAVVTVNAEENRPMLAINQALGFRPIGYEGAWRKDLPSG